MQVEVLSHTGGDDLKDLVRRIMTRCMTPQVSKNFNWEGRGAKIGLMQYRLSDAVTGIHILIV